MCEDGSQLALTGLLERLPLDVCLAAEGGELGHRFEEVVMGVDRVALWESIIEGILIEEGIDKLNVRIGQVRVVDRAIDGKRCLDPPVD